MSILNEKECADTEILIFTFTLINKTLAGISDQDTYYDMIDSLEEQGMEKIIKSFMSKKGIEKDLMKQLQIYELVLKHEDEGPASCEEGNIKFDGSNPHQFDLCSLEPGTVTTRGRSRASESSERRRSRRHSSVGHSLIGGNKNKTLSFVPPKNTKVIEDLVPNWQKKALESTQQYTSSSSNTNGSSGVGNFTVSRMLQEVNNNINSNHLSNSDGNNKSEGFKLKEVKSNNSTSIHSTQTAIKSKSMAETTTSNLSPSINIEETIVTPLKRDFRPSSKDGGDLMYNNFSGQRASISSTSSADSYGSSTSSGAYSMVSSTPSSADGSRLGVGGQKSPSFGKPSFEKSPSHNHAANNNTKTSLIEKRKKILFEQSQNSNKPSSEMSLKRNSINDISQVSSSNGSTFSMSHYNSNECIDTSKSYLLSKMYESGNHDEVTNQRKVMTNGATKGQSNKMSWEPVNDGASSLQKMDKSSIPGSSIGVKNIQEKMLRTGENNSYGNGHGVSSNIRDVIRNPTEFLHLHKPSSSSPSRKSASSPSRRPFRPLKLNDLDFTDLKPEDDQDILNGTTTTGNGFDTNQDGPGSPVIPCPPPLPSNAILQPPPLPPPPPPLPGMMMDSLSPSPSMSQSSGSHLQQQLNSIMNYNNNNNNSHEVGNKNNYNQTMTWLKSNSSQLNGNEMKNGNSSMSTWSVMDGHQNLVGMRGCIDPSPSTMYLNQSGTLKNKKTVKLFWKEVKEEKSILNRLKKKKTIWDEITIIPVDPVKMEHLFENRTKELVNKVRKIFIIFFHPFFSLLISSQFLFFTKNLDSISTFSLS